MYLDTIRTSNSIDLPILPGNSTLYILILCHIYDGVFFLFCLPDSSPPRWARVISPPAKDHIYPSELQSVGGVEI